MSALISILVVLAFTDWGVRDQTVRPREARVRQQPNGPAARPTGGALQSLAEDLSEEVGVGPVLDRVLDHSTRLLDSAAGSISLVDEGAGYYRKAADLGVACRSGQVFPLDEGVTGQVVAGRRRRFTAGEVDRLETVAQVAAVAITNTRRQAEPGRPGCASPTAHIRHLPGPVPTRRRSTGGPRPSPELESDRATLSRPRSRRPCHSRGPR